MLDERNSSLKPTSLSQGFSFSILKKKSSKSFFSLVVRRNSVFEQIDLQMGLFGKKKDGAVQVKKLGYEVNSKGKTIHDSRIP